MASFAAENTQDNVFLLLRSKDTFVEFRIEGNISREYSTAEKVDIEVLKATNCSLKSFKHFVCQARNQDIRLLEPGRELRTSNGVFGGLASTLPAGKCYY